MYGPLQIVGMLLSLGAFVCYILVVIKMFQKNATTPAIVSLVGLLACGLGVLFAFVYGWTKASAWNIQNIMIAWSVCIVVSIGINVATLPAAMEQMRQAAEQGKVEIVVPKVEMK
jgi:cobalamin biosynthesis protein CobD/CbiB